MVPSRSSTPGVYGQCCSWNCAKRELRRIGNRPWFALLAITALRTGANLPLKIHGTFKKEKVQFVPPTLYLVQFKEIRTPLPRILEEAALETEPEVYDVY